MASGDIPIKTRDHGKTVDEKKHQVRCNHRHKKVNGCIHVNEHLGSVIGDATTCPEAPADVEEGSHKEVHERDIAKLRRDLEYPPHSNSGKRTGSRQSNGAEPSVPPGVQAPRNGSRKRPRIGSPSRISEMSSIIPYSAPVTGNGNHFLKDVHKRIGKFFFETGLELKAVNLPSFRNMMCASHRNLKAAYTLPTSEDLEGWILEEEWKEMQEYAKKIRESWTQTGCSILLDGWQDGGGRNLLNILVACPKGTIYLRSADISGFDGDINSMLLFLDKVLGEVGTENVVQVITYTTSPWMNEVGEKFTNKYTNLFWTVNVSHCIKLMLEEIGGMEDTLVKAKAVTGFMHDHAYDLEITREHTSLDDLVRPSESNFTAPFQTVEYMVSERKNIQKMIRSTAWKKSTMDLRPEGRRVAELVADHCFWDVACMVEQVSKPLVRALGLLSENNIPSVAYVYYILDEAKAKIKTELKGKKSSHMPLWNAIDGIWNKYLHSPLHAAAAYLNPMLYYNDIYSRDTEVSEGLRYCISFMPKPEDAKLVFDQVDSYGIKRGAFGRGEDDIKPKTEIQPESQPHRSPASWWRKYGWEVPELRRLAIRILSQTCDGAAKYKLKRSLAERFLIERRNCADQKRVADFLFVHYNVQLQNFGHVDDRQVVEWMKEMKSWIGDAVPK